MIQKLKLENIRCFKKASFDFGEGVNLIIGSNGSGKTTILEAIGFFAFGRFQSLAQDSLSIKSGADVGRIEIELTESGKPVNASAAILSGAKIININGKKVPNSRIVGLQKAVFFNPETIDLVSGSPAVRRRELDQIIAQKKKSYVLDLLNYRRILHQRNELLRRIAAERAGKSELDFWDEQLGMVGTKIYEYRLKLIKKINQSIKEVHTFLLGNESALELKYVASVDYGRFDEALIGTLDADLRYGATSIGPHRDDFVFTENGFNLKDGASRGEQRVAAAAFKALSKDYLADGEAPVLIIDDIFSELDEQRREAVMHILQGGQIFISATDERVVPQELIKKAKTIKLS